MSSRLVAFDEAVAEFASEPGGLDMIIARYEDILKSFADLLEGKSPHDIVWGRLQPEEAGDPLLKLAAECVVLRLGKAGIEKIPDLAEYLGTEGYDRKAWCKFIREKRVLLPRDEILAQ